MSQDLNYGTRTLVEALIRPTRHTPYKPRIDRSPRGEVTGASCCSGMGRQDMGSAGRSHRAFRRVAAQLKAEAPSVCWKCGEDIDQDLHYQDPMAWTADHVVPLAYGGPANEISNLRPAHRSCNSRGGAEMTNGSPARDTRPRTSRDWH